MEKKLSEFIVGEKGKVIKITVQGNLRRRLFDMGVTPGAEILLRKKAPLGDPLELNLRGYELTIRKDDADSVLMEVTQ